MIERLLAASLLAAALVSGEVMPARPAADFLAAIGAATHFNYSNTAYAAWDLWRPHLAASGLRMLRDDIAANSTIRARHAEAATFGVRFIYICDQRTSGKLDPVLIPDWIARLKQHPIAQVAAIEGPNEYDLNHPSGDADWAATLRGYQQALYAAVKGDAQLAHLPVLAPSLGRIGAYAALGDLSAACDRGNIHPYPGGEAPEAGGLALWAGAARIVSGAKPIVATETGYHTALATTGTHLPVDEATFARYLPRLLLHGWQRYGLERTCIYEMVRQFPDPEQDEREKRFGLVLSDGTASPALESLRRLAGMLGPAVACEPGAVACELIGDTEGIERVLLDRGDGTYALILWQAASIWNTATRQPVAVPERQLVLRFGQPIERVAVHRPSSGAGPLVEVADPLECPLAVPAEALVVLIIPPRPTFPAIACAPALVTVREGDSARITVSAVGAGPLTYRWQRAAPEAAGWFDIAGASGASLVVPATSRSDDGARFRCMVTGAAGSAVSQSTQLSVVPVDPAKDAAGLIVVEAESADLDTAGTAGAAAIVWTPVTAVGAIGTAIAAMPDAGLGVGGALSGPRRDYRVSIQSAGTWYLWVRMQGAGANSDSLHLGANGVAATPAGGAAAPSSGWTWQGSAAGQRFTCALAAGPQTINLWMREDGCLVDRILATRDAAYVPVGDGPDATPREAQMGTRPCIAVAEAVTAPATGTLNLDVQVGDRESGAASVSLSATLVPPIATVSVLGTGASRQVRLVGTGSTGSAGLLLVGRDPAGNEERVVTQVLFNRVPLVAQPNAAPAQRVLP